MHNVIISTELVGQNFRAEEYKFHNRIITENGDVDYYKFDTLWYKGLSMVDKYNVMFTLVITSLLPIPVSLV